MHKTPVWLRYFEGTPGETTGGTAPATEQTTAETGEAPASKDTQEPQQKQEQETGHPWDDPVTARRLIEELRAENARDRVNAKEKAANDARAETVEKIMNALGLKQDDEQAPEDKITGLTQELSRERLQAQQAQLELAIYRAAGTHGADPDRLLDSRSFLDTVKDIDPTDRDAISQAIKTAVEANKNYRRPQAGHTANRSDHAPGGHTPSSQTLGDAVADYYRN